MHIATQRLTLCAVGIALFAALSLCLQMPVFENYYLCLGYVVMAVYCYSFGAAAGSIVGSLGVVLYCLVINGLRGMPGWALSNAVIGAALGLTFGITKNMRNKAVRTAWNAAAIAVSSLVGILLVKSVVESLLYSQLLAVRIGKNLYAFIADAAVLLLSLPVCLLVDPTARKLFPRLAKS